MSEVLKHVLVFEKLIVNVSLSVFGEVRGASEMKALWLNLAMYVHTVNRSAWDMWLHYA